MADSTPATNASNATRYYNLPLFLSSDRPSWLVDWNGAMNEIDTILNDIAIESEGASGAVATIQTQINTLSTTVENLNSIVKTAVADVASMQTKVTSMEDRLDNVESDLITQNNLIKTLSDTVVAMQSTVATLNNHVNVMEKSVTTLGANVEAVQTALTGVQSDVSSLQSSVSSINSSLSSLNTRVTALENAPSAGLPAISDLNFSETSYTRADFTQSASKTITMQNDCYVKIGILISATCGNVGVSDSKNITCEASLAGERVLRVDDTVPALYSVNPDFANVPFKASGFSGLYRLKAGDVISLSCGSSDTHDTTNFFVNIAPIA